jgi:hypothetical protein
MKKLFSVLLLTISTTSFASEIFREDFERIMLNNRSSFELVQPGMVSKTFGVQMLITDEDGKTYRCKQIVESTVLKVESNKYLTHEKIENYDNCEGQLTAGEINEHLEWNRLYSTEQYLDFMAKNYFAKFELENDNLNLNGITNYHDGSKSREFIKLIEPTKSQFYSVGISRIGELTSVMMERTIADPSQIKTDGLIVIELEKDRI